jgi:hypothetical protein
MKPSGTRGVLNDALAFYFGEATLASAFVARWCACPKIETGGDVFRVREDEPTPRVGAIRRTGHLTRPARNPDCLGRIARSYRLGVLICQYRDWARNSLFRKYLYEVAQPATPQER